METFIFQIRSFNRYPREQDFSMDKQEDIQGRSPPVLYLGRLVEWTFESKTENAG